MKRLLVLIAVLSLLVVAGTIVSAEGQTRHTITSKARLEMAGLPRNY